MRAVWVPVVEGGALVNLSTAAKIERWTPADQRFFFGKPEDGGQWSFVRAIWPDGREQLVFRGSFEQATTELERLTALLLDAAATEVAS